VIFNTLTDGRKLEILNDWPKYLDLLLKIEKKGVEERQNNIREALGKIESIISDALERDRQKAVRETATQMQLQENTASGTQYDAQKRTREFQKRLDRFRQTEKPPATPKPNPLSDPL
jgi:hypothetical protein